MHENVSLHKVDASQIADLKADLNHHGNAYHIQKSVTEKLCRLSKNMHGGLGSRGEAAVRRALSCTTWFIGQGQGREKFRIDTHDIRPSLTWGARRIGELGC